MTHTKQLLLVTICCTTAGIEVSFRTDGRTEDGGRRTDGRTDGRGSWNSYLDVCYQNLFLPNIIDFKLITDQGLPWNSGNCMFKSVQLIVVLPCCSILIEILCWFRIHNALIFHHKLLLLHEKVRYDDKIVLISPNVNAINNHFVNNYLK